MKEKIILYVSYSIFILSVGYFMMSINPIIPYNVFLKFESSWLIITSLILFYTLCILKMKKDKYKLLLEMNWILAMLFWGTYIKGLRLYTVVVSTGMVFILIHYLMKYKIEVKDIIYSVCYQFLFHFIVILTMVMSVFIIDIPLPT